MIADRPAPVSRRTLLGALGSVAAASTLPAPARAAAGLGPAKPPRRTTRALAHGSFEDWSAEVGSEFRMRTESGTKTLRLVAVSPMGVLAGRAVRRARGRAFAATFEATDGTVPAADRTYPLLHPRHGRLDLFFSPARERITAIFA